MKSNKKWMLVVLALLAVVALPLVGCKNDSVSEQTSGQSGEGEPRWLTFTSDSPTYLKVSFNGSIGVPNGMQYSTDRSTWTDFPESQEDIPFGKDTKLYLRGRSSTGTATTASNYVNFKFTNGTEVHASGDIRTLVDWQNPTTANTSNARFIKLFENCTQLVTAPELPATTLSSSCYYYMFRGCTGLTKAPALPAETLKRSCYENMFQDCTSLTEAPALPAETLAENCYWSMFRGCESLTKAPALPAPTLAENCYKNMFNSCKKLASVTMLATDVSAASALLDWLAFTADGGTLTVASGMEKNEKIKNSLPSGKNWTVVAKTN